MQHDQDHDQTFPAWHDAATTALAHSGLALRVGKNVSDASFAIGHTLQDLTKRNLDAMVLFARETGKEAS